MPPVCRAVAVASPSVETARALASADAPESERASAGCPPVASAVAVALSAPDVSAFAWAVATAPLAPPLAFEPPPQPAFAPVARANASAGPEPDTAFASASAVPARPPLCCAVGEGPWGGPEWNGALPPFPPVASALAEAEPDPRSPRATQRLPRPAIPRRRRSRRRTGGPRPRVAAGSALRRRLCRRRRAALSHGCRGQAAPPATGSAVSTVRKTPLNGPPSSFRRAALAAGAADGVRRVRGVRPVGERVRRSSSTARLTARCRAVGIVCTGCAVASGRARDVDRRPASRGRHGQHRDE